MEYDIVDGYTDTGLKLAVRRYIEQGWQPLGGIAVSDGRFYQTIIRRDEKYEMPNV